jgi:hypothetical protein
MGRHHLMTTTTTTIKVTALPLISIRTNLLPTIAQAVVLHQLAWWLLLVLEPPCPVATMITTHMPCGALKAASVVAKEEEESRRTSVKVLFPDISLLLGLNPIGLVILPLTAH